MVFVAEGAPPPSPALAKMEEAKGKLEEDERETRFKLFRKRRENGGGGPGGGGAGGGGGEGNNSGGNGGGGSKPPKNRDGGSGGYKGRGRPEGNKTRYFVRLNTAEFIDAEAVVSAELNVPYDENAALRRGRQADPNVLVIDAESVPQDLIDRGYIIEYEEDQPTFLFQFDTSPQDPTDSHQEDSSNGNCIQPQVYGNGTAWGIDRIDTPFGLDNEFGLAYDGTGVDVFLIDSGVDALHEQFITYNADGTNSSKIKEYWDCTTSPNDEDGSCVLKSLDAHRLDCADDFTADHGTLMAGYTVGTTTGIAPGANIYSYRTFPCSGGGLTSWIVNAVNAIYDRCTDPNRINSGRRCVINMSLGTFKSDILNTVVDRSVESGIIVTAAAGNFFRRSACRYSPASAELAITTAASNIDDDLADFSNIGPCVDFALPGDDILTSEFDATFNAYRTARGTSGAAAYLSGAAAVYLSQFPDATPAQFKQMLQTTSLISIPDNDPTQPLSYPLLHLPTSCGIPFTTTTSTPTASPTRLCGRGQISLTIKADSFFQTTWSIRRPDGSRFARGWAWIPTWFFGWTYNYQWNDNQIPSDSNCEWILTIDDFWGNGISSPGYYQLFSANTLLRQGGGIFSSFSRSESTNF